MSQEIKHTPELYYIQRVPSGYLGNSPFWWGKNGNGYTAYILGAARLLEEEAKKLVKIDPEKWKMFKCSEIDERLHLVYDMQDNRRLGTKEPCGWSGGYAQNPCLSITHSELLESLIECRELAAKGSKFAGDLTREAIEAGLDRVDEVIKKAGGQS